jgi:hypothetical protein
LSNGPKPLSIRVWWFDSQELFRPEMAKRIHDYSTVSSSYCLPKQVGVHSKTALTFCRIISFYTNSTNNKFWNL